jgi:hypothetical protein
MKPILRTLALVAVVALATACAKKDEPKKEQAAATPAVVLTAPVDNDTEGWEAYMTQEVKPYIDKRYRKPYLYFFPKVDEASPEKDEQLRQFQAQIEALQGAVARGIQAGSMIGIGGPAPAAIGDVVVESFKLAGPKSLKGVRVVVIGSASEKDRIQAAIAPSEAEFVWVEMK